MSERESKGEEQLPDYQSDRVLVVSSVLCKRLLIIAAFQVNLGCHANCQALEAVLAGDAQGGGSPLVGGAGARCVPALLAGRAACPPAWGEPSRPGFPPAGETGKGEFRLPCCRRQFAFA